MFCVCRATHSPDDCDYESTHDRLSSPAYDIVSRPYHIEWNARELRVASEKFPLPQPQFVSRTRVIVTAPTVFCVASPFLRQPTAYFARVVVRIAQARAAYPAQAVDLSGEHPFFTWMRAALPARPPWVAAVALRLRR